jgi:hypothetical protein
LDNNYIFSWNIQGDPVGNVNILAGEIMGHYGGKGLYEFCIILNGYCDSTVGMYVLVCGVGWRAKFT